MDVSSDSAPLKTPPARPGPVLWALLVVLVCVVCYLPSLRGGFLLDDYELIVENPRAQSLSDIPQAFTEHFLQGFVHTESLYYRPLITVSYQANYSLSGPDAHAYRATNLALYAICGLLVFLLVMELTGNSAAAGAAGIAFAVLPSHAESVAWIAGRTDIFSAIFMLAALLVFTSAWGRNRFSVLAAAGCSVLFLCGLLSKENAIMLPALMALYVYTIGRRPGKRELLKWGVALLPALVIYAILRESALGGAIGTPLISMLKERLLRVGVVYCAYLRMLLWPRQLSIFYDPYPLESIGPSPVVLVAWLVPIGLAALLVGLRKTLPILALAAGWILLNLLPAADLVPTSVIVPAERFAFMASVGSSVVIGWAVWRLCLLRPRGFGLMPVAVGAVALALAANAASLTIISTQALMSNLTWARYVAQTKPRYELFRASAAEFLADAGDYPAAAEEYRAAIRLGWDKFDDPARARIANELGVVYAKLRDNARAARVFDVAVQVEPNFGRGWRNLARARLRMKQYRAAADAYNRAFALSAPGARDLIDSAQAYQKVGLTEAAHYNLTQAKAMDPFGPLGREAQAALDRVKASAGKKQPPR